jgi:hypothetical protein
VAIVALLAPAAAIAAGPAAPINRYFVITSLVQAGQKADASGKLGIEGGQVWASVGCNFISGTASLDGDTLTIADGLAMTAIGCPEAQGKLEDLLVKVLADGPFRISPTEWTGNGAAIEVEEVPSGALPSSGAGPDLPVGSSAGPVIVGPAMTCPPILEGPNGDATGGEPGSAGGGTAGSGGATGSGDATGSGGEASGSSVGSSESETGPSATGVTIAPAPPGSPTVGVVPPPVSTDPGVVPPLIGTDPGVGKPVEPCFGAPDAANQLSGTGANGAGANGAGAAVPPKAADPAEHASDVRTTSDQSLPIGAVLAGLVALAVVGVLGAKRWRGRAAAAAVAVAPEEPGPTPR